MRKIERHSAVRWASAKAMFATLDTILGGEHNIVSLEQACRFRGTHNAVPLRPELLNGLQLKLNRSKMLTVAGVVSIGFALLFPGWLEVNRARKDAAKFVREASERQIEARVVASIKEIDNPFTWGNGKPVMVVARKAVDGNFMVLYANVSGDSQGRDKAFVSADCSGRKLRVVSRQVYEKYLTEVGYDVLGQKLPTWEAADYFAMLAVGVSEASLPAGQSVFFNIACKWDSYGPAAAKRAA